MLSKCFSKIFNNFSTYLILSQDVHFSSTILIALSRCLLLLQNTYCSFNVITVHQIVIFDVITPKFLGLIRTNLYLTWAGAIPKTNVSGTLSTSAVLNLITPANYCIRVNQIRVRKRWLVGPSLGHERK